MNRVLAIDYGTVRIGIALSHGTLAVPLTVLRNTAQVYEQIRALTKAHQVDQIVVGISENEMAVKTRAFAAELARHTELPIEFADETLSSHAVQKKLLHAKAKKRGGAIDHYAAAEFLQEWLDLQEDE